MASTATISPTRARYSDQEKALALAVLQACDGDSVRAAGLSGIPDSTLRNWEQGRGVNPAALQMGHAYAGEMLASCQRFALLAAGVSYDVLEMIAARVAKAKEYGGMDFETALQAVDTISKATVNVAKLAALLNGDATERTESRALSLHAILTARASGAAA